MKPESVTESADIAQHVKRFADKAKFIQTPEHVKAVLSRFPASERQRIYREVVALLPESARLKD